MLFRDHVRKIGLRTLAWTIWLILSINSFYVQNHDLVNISKASLKSVSMFKIHSIINNFFWQNFLKGICLFTNSYTNFRLNHFLTSWYCLWQNLRSTNETFGTNRSKTLTFYFPFLIFNLLRALNRRSNRNWNVCWKINFCRYLSFRSPDGISLMSVIL